MSKAELIIFGYNNIGLDVVTHLERRQQKFIIADFEDECVEKARANGYEAILIDLTNDQSLKDAGLAQQIKTVFCLFGEDSINVFLTISARAIDPDLNIISICHSEDANRKLLAAGATKVINPYQISGRKIYEIIRKPEVVELLDDVVFGQQDLNLVEVNIKPGCRLDQIHLNDFDISKEFNLVILGLEGKEAGSDIHFASSGVNFKLDAGDKLIVIGPTQEIENFRKKYAES